ncbi:MAG: acyltransferase [Ruminococcaceae bacterium]|nr:acyltransferase [Oscillospiraceae bacterium]
MMMTNMENKKRLVNLDLLKVVAMVMIVCLHYLGKGGILAKATVNDPNYYVAWLFEILSVAGVNCYVLSCGYLADKSKLRFSNIISLWMQVFFVNLVCAVCAIATDNTDFSVRTLAKCLLPVTSNSYWLITAYFIFCVLYPFFIWVAEKLSTENLKKLVITLTCLFAVIPWQWTKIDGGYHFVWFSVLFFFATYIKRADLLNRRIRVYLGRYALIVIVTVALKLVVDTLAKRSAGMDFSNYVNVTNPDFLLAFAASLMLFAAFKNLKIKRTKIAEMTTFLSGLTIGVYLIHSNQFIRKTLWTKVVTAAQYFNKPYFVFHMIVCVLAVFFICAFLEYFRQLLFKLFNIPSLCDKLGEKLQNLTDKLFSSKFIEKL